MARYRIPLNEASNREVARGYLGLQTSRTDTYLIVTDGQLNHPIRSTAAHVRGYFLQYGMTKIEREPGDLPERYGPYRPIPRKLPA